MRLDNLGGIYCDINGEIKMVCNRIECLIKAAEEVKRAKENRAEL